MATGTILTSSQFGTWTPQLYDYETYLQDLDTSYYIKIGKLVILFCAHNFSNTSPTFSTMMEIRNLPFSMHVYGGSMFLSEATGLTGINAGGSITVQSAINVILFRPNITGTITANNYGYFHFCVIGYLL